MKVSMYEREVGMKTVNALVKNPRALETGCGRESNAVDSGCQRGPETYDKDPRAMRCSTIPLLWTEERQ